MRTTRAETTFNRRNPWPFLAFVALALMGIVALRPEPSAPVAASAPIGPVFTATPQPTTEPVMQCGVDGRPCIVVWATAETQPTATLPPTALPTATVQPCATAKPGEWCWQETPTPAVTPVRTPPICSPTSPVVCIKPSPTIVPTRSAS